MCLNGACERVERSSVRDGESERVVGCLYIFWSEIDNTREGSIGLRTSALRIFRACEREVK